MIGSRERNGSTEIGAVMMNFFWGVGTQGVVEVARGFCGVERGSNGGGIGTLKALGIWTAITKKKSAVNSIVGSGTLQIWT